MKPSTPNGAWVFFDADNTLWHVEHLYDDARDRFCAELSSLHQIDPVVASEYQQARDKELYQTYGYSACRFARSFEDTLLHFVPHAAPELVRHVRAIATEVFDQPAVPAEGLEEALKSLVPHFKLAIVTAGERWVQERRLATFCFREYFSAIDIVETKTAEVFSRIVAAHSADPHETWVIGDSIRSDILPATAAGLRAVLVVSKNWERVERQDLQLPSGALVASSITSAVKLINDERLVRT
jgi:putative hydrolase of the HAD superfamily